MVNSLLLYAKDRINGVHMKYLKKKYENGKTILWKFVFTQTYPKDRIRGGTEERYKY